MAPDDGIVNGDKITVLAITAFGFWLPADSRNPLVSATWLITALSGFCTFKPFCKDIFPTRKQRTKKSDLSFLRGVICCFGMLSGQGGV
jgi:hypothetical protein